MSKTGDHLTQATLLLIDDDVSALARMADQLSAAGYEIVKATEAGHAQLFVRRAAAQRRAA